MTITVETGSGDNADANSYQAVDDLRAYASLRGLTVPAADADCEVLLIKAMDFIEAQSLRFKGKKAVLTQPLSWPRSDVWNVEGSNELMGSDVIPRHLRYAQLALAYEAIANELQPNALPTDKGAVRKEKIGGAIEIEYESTGNLSQAPAFAKPVALLSALYKNNGLALVRT